MPIYHLETSTGTLDVYENRVVITQKIPLERDGFYERIIPIKSIKAIQFKGATKKQGGYLQFMVLGCSAQNILSGGAEVKDNNAVVFAASEQENALQIKNYIVDKII